MLHRTAAESGRSNAMKQLTARHAQITANLTRKIGFKSEHQLKVSSLKRQSASEMLKKENVKG